MFHSACKPSLARHTTNFTAHLCLVVYFSFISELRNNRSKMDVAPRQKGKNWLYVCLRNRTKDNIDDDDDDDVHQESSWLMSFIMKMKMTMKMTVTMMFISRVVG